MREFFVGLVPPAVLILVTLGTILTGLATPTEGAALGCLGAVVVTAANGRLTFKLIKESAYPDRRNDEHGDDPPGGIHVHGGGLFLHGNAQVHRRYVAVLEHAALGLRGRHPDRLFHPGWPLEWVPIVVVIVPIFLPILNGLQVDMIWFGIVLAVTLQSCWISPPVALSAYYLKAIMPEWELSDIYKGMMPFMACRRLGVLLTSPADHDLASRSIRRPVCFPKTLRC